MGPFLKSVHKFRGNVNGWGCKVSRTPLTARMSHFVIMFAWIVVGSHSVSIPVPTSLARQVTPSFQHCIRKMRGPGIRSHMKYAIRIKGD